MHEKKRRDIEKSRERKEGKEAVDRLLLLVFQKRGGAAQKFRRRNQLQKRKMVQIIKPLSGALLI